MRTPSIRTCLTFVAMVAGAAGESACMSPLVPSGEEAIRAVPEQPMAPNDNPITEEKRELGFLLFWDPLLSGNRDVACASCHDPKFAYTDGRPRAIGTGGAEVARNTPTVLHTGWNGLRGETVPRPEDAPMFWDSRARSLESQAKGPLHAEPEMRGALPEAEVSSELTRRLAAIPEYAARFAAAFGSNDITEDRVAMAIATFERTLTTGTSRFDRFMRGDERALSISEKRGLTAFFAAGCANCHGGPMFSDFEPHALGAGTAHHGVVDQGDGRGRFRTPSLRNVTKTAPYMHDGSLSTLDAVYDFYNRIDRDKDPLLGEVGRVTGSERDDLTAFLASLADEVVDERVPTDVPSGLPVGGTRRR
jgi:cytochrome c peroxidase